MRGFKVSTMSCGDAVQVGANTCTLLVPSCGAWLLGAVLAEPQNSQDMAEPGMGKLFAVKVLGNKWSWKKILQAFKRFVTFWGFTEVIRCFPMSGIFLLFRLMALVIPSEIFPPH